MQYISINSIGDFPEDFLLAKKDIEKLLLENGTIQNKMKLDEFILYLNIQENIYIKGKQTMAFKVMKGATDTYLLYTYANEDTLEEDLNSLNESLNAIKYDLSKLNKLSMETLLTSDLDNPKMFMINSQFYSVDE